MIFTKINDRFKSFLILLIIKISIFSFDLCVSVLVCFDYYYYLESLTHNNFKKNKNHIRFF